MRLEYSNGKSRGRMVDPIQLEHLFKNPLMRSANAIAGLFYDGVVVTESDNDRSFYAEIYHRLLAANVGNLPSVLFINAQNKQTIKDIIGPLRQFGVPAAAIPDIDIVKDGGKTWTDWLASAQVPSALHAGYQAQRSAIKDRFDASGKDMKSGGVEVLTGSDRLAADQLFDTLAEHGIFVVRRGELENWLSTLGVPGKKTDWTVAMLRRLGSDPADPNYVKPAAGDVWDFISKVVAWIGNSAHRGTA